MVFPVMMSVAGISCAGIPRNAGSVFCPGSIGRIRRITGKLPDPAPDLMHGEILYIFGSHRGIQFL